MVLQDERVSNKIGMFLMDHQMRIIHVDPVAAELLGWSKPQELVGRLCWEVMHGRDTTGDNPCNQECLPLQLLRGGRSAPKWVLS
ncbi:MAG: PAS domain-containing protein, partial [Dehalococcoidia bacterium]|nr:PAS domain-containing protein [Dehalococcoidia bacterium]